MKVFRVMVGQEMVGVEDSKSPIPLIQEVVYVVAERRSDIARILRSQKMRGLYKFLAEVPTPLPLWQVKFGHKSEDISIFNVVGAKTARDVGRALRVLYQSEPTMLDLIEAGMWRHGPVPIDTTREGVW